MNRLLASLLTLYVAAACALPSDGVGASDAEAEDAASDPFKSTVVATFKEPWAMTFLPGREGQMLVTEKSGQLFVISAAGKKSIVAGVPRVDYGGQGGLGDVIVHPDFVDNGVIYLSYVESGNLGRRGAAVARAVLSMDDGAALHDVEVIWRQDSKVSGRGHYGHRLAFDKNGFLFVSSGERQKFTPAQDMDSNLGKILRLHDDGRTPADNPFADKGGVSAQIWSLGHRNPLGLAFDAQGRLWNHEMGPAGGDEFNLVKRGANYGYPIVSNGNHYNGRPIPDHATRPEFAAPAIWWTPVISPAGLIFYSGERFADWHGDALIASLGAQALIRVRTDGDSAREIARYGLGKRIREVEQGPTGDIWLLEDGSRGRLLRLTPND